MLDSMEDLEEATQSLSGLCKISSGQRIVLVFCFLEILTFYMFCHNDSAFIWHLKKGEAFNPRTPSITNLWWCFGFQPTGQAVNDITIEEDYRLSVEKIGLVQN
ncbi:hypothetical protein CHARACLAT_012485 [Characodon lateralis]|uniref:Uncharacterized protein n=1 Tax=Characodon lateralis TaxID=208331 RepID=A0ABU7ET52_9TELE|nr:hypothetical protein [Characodon lateralis]